MLNLYLNHATISPPSFVSTSAPHANACFYFYQEHQPGRRRQEDLGAVIDIGLAGSASPPLVEDYPEEAAKR